MYSYLHKYHAGNFADVHKHVTLLALVNKLKQKETPFCILDAFAGEGLYDLSCREAKLNKEHNQGIKRLLGHKLATKNLNEYFDLVQALNADNITTYPGSPAIILELLRDQDRAIAVEGHPQVFETLKSHLGKEKSMNLHHRDSFEAMTALLPFKEKRGLVFIDPSYEVKADYKTIILTIQEACKKMPNAIFALWYPILKENYHKNMIDRAVKADFKNLWISEWMPTSEEKAQGLLGSGMLIINKPWQLENSLTATFIELNKTVFKTGRWYQKTLVEN